MSARKTRGEGMDRRMFLEIGAGVAGSLLVGLDPSRAWGADVKIAGLLALTGTNAAWGQKTANSFQLAWDIINQRGGVKALGGAKVAYTLADTDRKSPHLCARCAPRLLPAAPPARPARRG